MPEVTVCAVLPQAEIHRISVFEKGSLALGFCLYPQRPGKAFYVGGGNAARA